MICSSSSIRSSYSSPSAFISAIASPRASLACAIKTGKGSSRIASTTDSTLSVYSSDSGSSRSNASSANEASGWLSAKSSCRWEASRSVRPCSSASSSRSSTPESSSSSLSDAACSERRRLPRSSSWLSSISARIVSIGSAGWLMTLRIIAWLTRIRETSGSGEALRSLS